MKTAAMKLFEFLRVANYIIEEDEFGFYYYRKTNFKNPIVLIPFVLAVILVLPFAIFSKDFWNSTGSIKEDMNKWEFIDFKRKL